MVHGVPVKLQSFVSRLDCEAREAFSSLWKLILRANVSSFNLSRAGLRGAERGYFQCVSWMAWTLSRQCCNSTEVTQTNGLRQAMRLEMRIGKGKGVDSIIREQMGLVLKVQGHQQKGLITIENVMDVKRREKEREKKARCTIIRLSP